MGHSQLSGRGKHASSASHERDQGLCDDKGADQILLLSGLTEGKSHLLRHRFSHTPKAVGKSRPWPVETG